MPQLERIVAAARECAIPLSEPKSLGPLIQRLSGARIVMLGEASHGTHEFYEWRRVISEWLIVKHGFRFIAVEGDWPPCQRVNRYVRSLDGHRAGQAREALEAFTRWPTWMWANTEVIRLAEWMKQHNLRVGPGEQVGFHGIDVYSLFESIEAAIAELRKINPFLAKRAAAGFACFDPFKRDERSYSRYLLRNPEGCESQVVQVLQDLLKTRLDRDGEMGESLFDAQQNARIVKNAEDYYRTMMLGGEDSWNVRDRHMLETLEILLDRYGPDSKAIVWAHNTHIGDYRATDMGEAGLVNLGGLARERFGEGQVALVGFSTYEGKVIASHSWEGPIQTLKVPPARHGSYDHAFHETSLRIGAPQFYLVFDPVHRPSYQQALGQIFGQRAIGVVYDPEHERFGNYVPTSLSQRYDAMLFFDRTRALEPLILPVDRREIPETWPIGQ